MIQDFPRIEVFFATSKTPKAPNNGALEDIPNSKSTILFIVSAKKVYRRRSCQSHRQGHYWRVPVRALPLVRPWVHWVHSG